MPKNKIELYWFVHHECILEPIVYAIEERINFIKYSKAQREQKSRLEALKPVKYPHWLPKEIWPALRKASRMERGRSTEHMQSYWEHHPKMLAKVRRRLFLEYPKCPANHIKDHHSFLAYDSLHRRRVRIENRKMFGK